MSVKKIITDYYPVAGTRNIVLTVEQTVLRENISRVINITKERTYYDTDLWKYFITISNNVITFDDRASLGDLLAATDDILIELDLDPVSPVKILQSAQDVGASDGVWVDIADERYIRDADVDTAASKMIEEITIQDSAQVDTITLVGTAGTANVGAAGGLTKLVTFAAGGTQDLTQTAADFVTSHATAYLKLSIIVTSVGETIVFTANAKGIIFTNPTITPVAGNLDGSNAATTPNTVAVAQVDTLTLTGTIGETTIGAAGGLSKIATFATDGTQDLTQTASNFVTTNAAAYLGQAIVLTSSGADLIFTAQVAGTGFTNPTSTPIAGDLDGSVANTQANVAAVAQVDTVTITGTGGTAYVGATGGFSNLATFNNDLTDTASDFVTLHAAEYAGIGITLTSSTADLIFTADVAGTSFVSPIINNDTGDLAGSVANTQANVVAVAQVDTVSMTGTDGQSTIAAAGGLTRIAYFDTSLTITNQNFVTLYAADYLAQAIVLTSSVADLIFTAQVAGTGFTNPTSVNTPGDLDGSVANTQANVPAVAQVDTVTLTGTLGGANMTVVGGLTKAILFNSSLTQTATDFDTAHSAAYTAEGITVTSSGDDIIFTAAVAGTPFSAPVVDNSDDVLDGTVANTLVDTDTGDTYGITTANRPEYEYTVLAAVAQVDTITLTGASGTANVTLAGGLTKLATFAAGGTQDLPQTAADFVTSHAAAYLVEGITITNSGDDIIFTATQAGAAFTSPAIANVSGDLAGSVANTQANVIASEAIIAQGLVDLVEADGSKDAAATRSNGVVTLTYTAVTSTEAITSCNLDASASDETYISDPNETQELVYLIEDITIPQYNAPIGTVYSITTANRPAYEHTMAAYLTPTEIAAALVVLINADGSADAVATSVGAVITLTYTTWTSTSALTAFTYDGDTKLLGDSKMTINAVIDKNDAAGVQVKVLGKNNLGVVTEYEFASNSNTFSDADQNTSFTVDVTGFIAVAVQTRATTVGATKGTIALTATTST